MNKENNKSAAGLRRSAVAERIRLRDEWSALKGPESRVNPEHKTKILTKKQTNMKTGSTAAKNVNPARYHISTRNMLLTNDTLRGVVALVEVGTECRALPLRAALSALGASVLPAWSPLVTHLVWSQGGCRATRAKARALASSLVSPLWVEACAAASKRLPEHAFPAAARASDLPSPRTLRQLLKKAEMENIPLVDLLSDSAEEKQRTPRLRMSSETERDTSGDLTTDTSRDMSKDTSNDTSADVESRVNTAPRRALPELSESVSPARPAKSRRKLFTHKEDDLTMGSDDSDDNTSPKPNKPTMIKNPTTPQPKLTQRNRKELARAERVAQKILAGCSAPATQTSRGCRPRIVLTGMSREERRAAAAAVRALGGRLQRGVDRRTTHVLLGSCGRDDQGGTPSSGAEARTLRALAGAARGARVLRARWAARCRRAARWLPPAADRLPHLPVAQKARVERSALGKMHSEYAYDVFCGRRVRLAAGAARAAAAAHLLALCGARLVRPEENDIVQNGGMTQNGGRTQNGGQTQNGGRTQQVTQSSDSEFDIEIGDEHGMVSSKWVFDSVAAGRMRSTRRYVVNSLPQSDIVTQMERFQC